MFLVNGLTPSVKVTSDLFTTHIASHLSPQDLIIACRISTNSLENTLEHSIEKKKESFTNKFGKIVGSEKKLIVGDLFHEIKNIEFGANKDSVLSIDPEITLNQSTPKNSLKDFRFSKNTVTIMEVILIVFSKRSN